MGRFAGRVARACAAGMRRWSVQGCIHRDSGKTSRKARLITVQVNEKIAVFNANRIRL